MSKNKTKLMSVAGDIAYEVKMLGFTGSKLLTRGSQLNEEVNTFLESFLIHFRNLLDFFYPSSPRTNDILATHYFEETLDWPKIRPKIPSYFKKNRTRLDKLLAHLTYDRAKYVGNKEWDVKKIMAEIHNVWSIFFRTLPNETKEMFTKNNMIPVRWG